MVIFCSMKDGCIQHARTQIKDVEQLQKLPQSVCQSRTGRPGASYVQVGTATEISLFMGEKGVWFDKVTAERCWIAWL